MMMQSESINNVECYRPMQSNILFKFLQDVDTGTFTNKTKWGLEVRNRIEDVKTPRWGIVYSTGSEVPTRIKKGTYILIEQLMWTNGFKIDEVKHWITGFDKVLAISEEEPTDIF